MRHDRFSSALLVSLLLITTGCTNQNAAQSISNAQAEAEVNDRQQPLQFTNPQAPLAVALTTPDAKTTAITQQYLKKLAAQGYPASAQGIWIQSGDKLLANHQGTTPLSAASLTKVATSLAALKQFGADHRFETNFATTGTIENGVLTGDLIVQGSDDPFFVWEEAIAIGNSLNQLGIRQVKGNLIVVGRFFMNFEPEPAKSGALLKQAFNSKTWAGEVLQQYQTLSVGTPKPNLAIAGTVKVVSDLPQNAQGLARHRSLPLAELLKKMNRYSNNMMAEIIANSVGGAKAVSFAAAQAAGVPQTEILLVNGSGLAVENRISPRAVCSMFLAIEQLLKPTNLTIADIFAVVGQDTGILEERKLPNRMVTKSGSLDAVSALAGAIPTRDNGIAWFVIMNGGGSNLEGFRASQEAFLNTLAQQWGTVTASPPTLATNPARSNLKAIVEKAQ
jgi:D-alanyl-D-alanine carboxypeptidase/D-alanyl-D-alanine-endopeptidase (penicillin-binding protein 4)